MLLLPTHVLLNFFASSQTTIFGVVNQALDIEFAGKKKDARQLEPGDVVADVESVNTARPTESFHDR